MIPKYWQTVSSRSLDPRSPSPLLTRPFLLAWGANFLQGLALSSYLHLPGFLEGLGASKLEIGLLYGTMSAAAIAARPPVGRAMDLRGRRLVFVGGSVLQVVVCALFLTVTSLGAWLVVVRIAQGIAEAMTFSSLFTYVADIVPPERRTEGIALFGVSGLLPMSLAGLLGDQVIALFGYRDLFALTVVFSLLGLVLVLPLRDAARPAGPERRGMVAAALQPDLLPLWFMGSVFAVALASVFTFLKTFVLATGIGTVGLFFTAYSASAVLLRLTLAWVPDRIGPKRALFPAVGCLAAGLGLIALASSSTSLAIAGADGARPRLHLPDPVGPGRHARPRGRARRGDVALHGRLRRRRPRRWPDARSVDRPVGLSDDVRNRIRHRRRRRGGVRGLGPPPLIDRRQVTARAPVGARPASLGLSCARRGADPR